MTQTSRFFFTIALFLWIVVGFMTCNKAYGQSNSDFKAFAVGNFGGSPAITIRQDEVTVKGAIRTNGHWIITNDTTALESMYKAFMQIDSLLMERDKERELMREIIRYLNRDGSITNLKRYKAACDDYIRWQKKGKL